MYWTFILINMLHVMLDVNSETSPGFTDKNLSDQIVNVSTEIRFA